ncbi:MAG TPA: hypothetical protein DEP84_29210, partial [Chloroflexi bacterium]|nr:hypothetical protein [Chloroflexota bacterium]
EPLPSPQPATPTPAIDFAAIRRSTGLASTQSLTADGATLENPGPLFQRLPKLPRTQAPEWLQEGVRVTYYVATASIPRNRYYYYRDEHGAIIEADEVGPAGAGLVQFDLVALERSAAVSSVAFFVGLENGVAIPWGLARSIGTPSAGEYWLHPDSLQAPDLATDGELTVARMPITLDGRTYQGVRISYQTDDAENTSVYDETTGLLLYSLQAVGKERGTHKSLSLMYFKNLRQLELPWRRAWAPDWVTTGRTLRYDGTVTILVPGSPRVPLEYSIRSKVIASHARWSEFDATHYTSGQFTSQVQQVTGVAQISYGSWLPPEAAASLRRGQVLDRDPLTEIKVVVSRVSRDVIVLTETGPSHRIVSTFDRNDGTLLAIDQETVMETATTQIQVQLRSRR